MGGSWGHFHAQLQALFEFYMIFTVEGMAALQTAAELCLRGYHILFDVVPQCAALTPQQRSESADANFHAQTIATFLCAVAGPEWHTFLCFVLRWNLTESKLASESLQGQEWP